MNAKDQYELEQAARELARNFIRAYVTRGDTYGQLRASHMGVSSRDYTISIGGYMNEKFYSTEFMIVPKLNGITANIVFKLSDIYREVEGEIMSARALEDFHLE